MPLSLKIFRGEPAITEFDQNFSPIHNSSPNVAQLVGSVLQSIFIDLQPGHGQLTRFRVMCQLLNALSDLISLRLRPFLSGLSSQLTAHSQAHSSIGILSPAISCDIGVLAHCKHTVSGTISPPSPGYFSPFPHGTCSLSIIKSIQPQAIVGRTSDGVSRVPPYSETKTTH